MPVNKKLLAGVNTRPKKCGRAKPCVIVGRIAFMRKLTLKDNPYNPIEELEKYNEWATGFKCMQVAKEGIKT